MAAPPGNKFWELRSKHGRDPLFATPALMWEAACEYFDSVIENPWYKYEQPKKGSLTIDQEEVEDALSLNPGIETIRSSIQEQLQDQLVKIPVTPPFTMQGLCNYLDCSLDYFRSFKKNCSIDFSGVIDRIERTIYNQKYSGAAVGAFNANIIARDLGLKDSSEISGPDGGPIKHTLEIVHVISNVPLASSEEEVELRELPSSNGNGNGHHEYDEFEELIGKKNKEDGKD